MSITTNKIRVEGNTIYLSGNPVGGLIGAFTVFVESIVGQTSEDFFIEKNFRYSKNGVEFTPWQPLTLATISAISFDRYDTPLLEFAYTKSIPDGLVDVTEIEVDTNEILAPILSDIFNSTIFNYLFSSNDERVLTWTLSVLKKIYEKGLLASYVGRKNNNDSVEDFVILWKTVSQYFAFYVIYMREYERFFENYDLLTDYLTQKGLVVSPTNTLEELYLMMESLYRQMSYRGTIKIIDSKDSNDIIDGEFRRLIHYQSRNEFLFNLHKTQHFGWNLGNSSPLYRGLYIQDNLLKESIDSEKNIFVVSSKMNYEATFLITTGDNVKINITSKDKDGNLVNLLSCKTGVVTTNCLDNILYRDDKIILVRVCLYNHDKEADVNDKLNINLGNNIILNENSRTVEIDVTFNNTSQDFNKLGARILPLFTEYSHGLIQVYNWISCWIENNNLSLTREQIQEFTQRYLVPYNSVIRVSDISQIGSYNEPVDPITPPTPNLAWRPIQGICEYVIEPRETMWIGNQETSYCEQFVDNNIWIGDEETAECVQVDQ